MSVAQTYSPVSVFSDCSESRAPRGAETGQRRAWLLVHAALAGLLAAVATAGNPPPPDVLTEFAASGWGAEAEGSTAAVYDDGNRVQVGSASLRFETGGCFDTWLWAPVTRAANWDFSNVRSLRFLVYAENGNSTGFQNASPWIRIGSAAGYYQYQTSGELLNLARNNWLQVDVPITGDGNWQRSVSGTPDLTDIDYIEIHADTWGCAFTLWFDGMEFTPLEGTLPPPQNLRATPYYSTAQIAWDASPEPEVVAYDVYRRPVGGTYGAPLRRVLVRSDFNDYGLEPGETYYYRLIGVDANGGPLTRYTPELPVTLGTDPTPYSTHKNFEMLVVFYTGGYLPAEVQRLTEGLRLGMEFYWRTTRGRMNMDVTWLYIDTLPPGPDWYNAALQADLRSRGVQDNQYDLGYLVGQDLAGCLGGYVVFGSMCASLGTACGVPYPSKQPGIDYTIAWTFTHEIHHALEAMENRTAGTPEVLFCHFPWCYPDPLGPTGWHMDWGAHYDGIAQTNREYGDDWMLYPPPYDGYIECIDADGDDLPDDDGRVWLDELRFGSSPALADTDDDGLDDLGEYSAYNFRATDPLLNDTDGDGLLDGEDLQPLYPIRMFLPYLHTPPTIDGVLEPGWPKLREGYYYTRNIADYALESYAGWTDDALYLAFSSERRLRFMLSFDGSGLDGRFESPVRHVQGANDPYNTNNKENHIGDTWGDGHHIYFAQDEMGARVVGRSAIPGAEVRSSFSGGQYHVEVKLPRALPGGAAFTWYLPSAPVVDGMTLENAHLVGLNLTMSNYDGSNEGEFSGIWTSLFESHAYVDFYLRIPGDMTCDGDIDNEDIDPFVLALTRPALYTAIWPACDFRLADVNLDGDVDNEDIDAFVELLAQ